MLMLPEIKDCVFFCLQNRNAYYVKVVASSRSPQGPGVGFGRLTGREVKGWVGTQRLGSLGKHGKK